MAIDAASLAKLGFDPERPASWPSSLSEREFADAFPRESEVVEFKQGLSSTAIQESIVAFSNSRGGVILAGVANNGRIVGVEWTPAIVDQVTNIARDANSPGTVVVRPLLIGQTGITVIGVAPLREGFAQTSSGRVLVRVGTQRLALIGSALSRFIQERAASSFESVPVDAASSEISDRYRSALAGRLGISDARALDDRLEELGIIKRVAGEPRLTVVGALYLLEHPERWLGKAYIEILRIPAGARSADRRVEVTGPLPAQVEAAVRFVQDELGVDEVVLGLRRHELPRLPERVVREVIANAVAHRSYEQRGTPVRIELHPDRVVVQSPGGLVAPVTLATMRDQHAARNNTVIRVLRAFQLAEDQGKGIDLIEDMMRDELLARPEFSATETSVTVTLPVLSGTSPEERAWVREVESRGKIEERDRVLLVHARRGELLTNQRARELLNAGRDAAMHALRRLAEAGLLERFGERGGTRYQLAKDLAPPAGLRLSRAELSDLIIGLAADRPITNQLVRQATGLDRQATLSLLDELVTMGRLDRVGERRGTRYVIPSSPTP
jgi:ATP-dependent DNA helicase RecG